MIQKIKKLLMVIVGLLVSINAFAHNFEVDGIYYKYLDETAKTVAVTYKGSYYDSYSNEYTGSVTIPSSVTYSGTTYSVTSIRDYAFYYCDGLTEVTIPNSVTSIGSYAFCACRGLTSITIPNSVTSIGDDAFRGCSGLTSITIPNSVTSIRDYAFFGCSGLTSVTIPNSVTSIGNYAFCKCSGLTEVIVEDGNTKYDSRNNCNGIIETATNSLILGCKNTFIPNSVTSIGGFAFYYCDGLTSITIPNSVTSIGDDAFDDCTGLAELIIEDGQETLSLGYNYYSSSTIGGGLFYDCPIEKLYLGRNLDYNTDESYGYSPFYNKTKLKEVKIGNSVTSIGSYAFQYCTGFSSITIPISVTSVGRSAFTGIEKVIWLTNTPPSGYSNAGGTMNYVANDQYSSLLNVVVYPYLSSMFEVDGVKYVPVSPSERTCDAIDCSYNSTDSIINIGNTVSFKGVAMSVKDIKPYTCFGNDYIKKCTINYNGNIGRYAFYSCDSLVSLNLSANNIGNYAFSGCSAIENATIKSETIGANAFQSSATKNPATFSIDTKSISDYAFNGCSAIEKVTINAESIANSAFKGCSAIEKVTIKSETIGEYAFQNSATINPATFYVDAKSIAESTFDGCSEIETITLGTELETIGNSAFNSCSKLNEVIIPNSVTSLGESAFYGCSSLVSATIGNAVKNINASTFYNCKSLENIIIGNGVKSIGENSFYGCSTLPIIEIPKNVTSIGDYAFDNCSNLSNVIIEDRNTVLTLGSNGSSPMFSDCPLDSVYIGGDISYKTTSSYGYSPFYNNKTLRAVTITDKETEISDNEFYGCANLKSVSIGDGVETIGKYAFSGCSSLESFAFGTSMKTIGEEAFSDCTALVKLHSKAMTPPVCGTQALDDINKWNCELYVPGVSISAYQAADQWKEFFFMYDGVEGVKIDCNAIEVSRYDIHGRLLSEPTPGINIVKMSNGTTRKEIIK